MRPQLFSCGNRHQGISGDLDESRFNEAAALQLRKRKEWHAVQPNGATCFNEAAALQLRKPTGGKSKRKPAATASMRPQLFSGGNRGNHEDRADRVARLQ